MQGGVQKKKNGRVLDNRTYDDKPLVSYIAAE
jgi:protein gp37